MSYTGLLSSSFNRLSGDKFKLSDLLLSDRFFSICCFISLSTYGMCWTIPGTLIYDIKLNIGEGMKTFGYLMMVMRLGKLCGHLGYMFLSKRLRPKSYIIVHLIAFFVKGLAIVLIPMCTSWISLGVNFFVIGIQLGFIESNLTFINTAANGNEAKRFTNVYYFSFSVGCFITTLIVNATKQTVESSAEEHKHHLSICCWIVGGITVFYNILLFLFLVYRRQHGAYLGQVKAVLVEESEDKPSYFKRPIISTIALLLAAYMYMCARTIIDLYLLPFATSASADLDDIQPYSVLQTVFLSSMITRLLGLFLPYFIKKAWIILALCNTNVLLSVVSFMVFKDRTYTGIIITMIMFGISNGSFQNSLVNWMTDQIKLNPTNSAPFFLATVLGSTSTPAIFPYIIKNEDGSTDISAYMLSIILTFSLAASSCIFLMISEQSCRDQIQSDETLLRQISEVKVVQILPGSPMSYRIDEDDVSIPTYRTNSSVITFRQRAASAFSTPQTLTPVLSFALL